MWAYFPRRLLECMCKHVCINLVFQNMKENSVIIIIMSGRKIAVSMSTWSVNFRPHIYVESRRGIYSCRAHRGYIDLVGPITLHVKPRLMLSSSKARLRCRDVAVRSSLLSSVKETFCSVILCYQSTRRITMLSSRPTRRSTRHLISYLFILSNV